MAGGLTVVQIDQEIWQKTQNISLHHPIVTLKEGMGLNIVDLKHLSEWQQIEGEMK